MQSNITHASKKKEETPKEENYFSCSHIIAYMLLHASENSNSFLLSELQRNSLK